MRLNAIPVVLAINVALAGGLAYLWNDAERTRWTEPAPLPPALEDVAAAAAPEPADITRYRETIERPLFAANRKPAPRGDTAADAEAADALKDVKLLGTYGAGDKGGIIVLRGGKVERVAIGESLGGWKVTGGSRGRSAELARADGQRRQLELALNNTAPAGTSAAKSDGQDAGQAAVGEPPAGGGAPAAAPQRASSQRDRSAWGGRASSPEARQQRIDRINQRRASRGQPPLPQNR